MHHTDTGYTLRNRKLCYLTNLVIGKWSVKLHAQNQRELFNVLELL